MSESKIINNTIFLYIRMIILILVGLYTSRVLLEKLGAEDLGIYNVVASVVLMLEFVSSSLVNASQRYISIGIGKNDFELTNKYFSQSTGIHFLLSLIIVLLLETIGLWILNNKLLIPQNRIDAAFWIFQLSVFIAFLKINQICFQSVIISRENMSIYSYLGIFEGIAKLLIVFLLGSTLKYDKLIFYGCLLAIVQVIIFFIYIIYCNVKYKESKYKFIWDKELSKEMLGFASLNIFGSFSWAMGNQGINVVLNMFFGAIVNASRGLASTFGRLINQLVDNVYTVIKPRIIKLYAKGETENMLLLAEKSSVYIFYMVFMLIVPIFLETGFILKLWLHKVPEYTNMYTKLVLVQSLIWMLPIPYSQIATATGKIKKIQMYGRIFTLLSLPISYFVLTQIKNPYYPILIVITMDSCYWLYTISVINEQLNISFSRYINNVLKPIVVVAITLSISVYFVYYFINFNEFFNFMTICLSTVILGFCIIYNIGIGKLEKDMVRSFIIKKLSK